MQKLNISTNKILTTYLMFAKEDGAYPSAFHTFQVFLARVGSDPYPHKSRSVKEKLE
jgi:hypothetical protein